MQRNRLYITQKGKVELIRVARSIAAFGFGCRAIFQRVSFSDARSRSHRSEARWNFSRSRRDLLLRALFHHSVGAISPLDRSKAFDSERRHGASDGSPFSAATEHRRRRHGGFQTGHIFFKGHRLTATLNPFDLRSGTVHRLDIESPLIELDIRGLSRPANKKSATLALRHLNVRDGRIVLKKATRSCLSCRR